MDLALKDAPFARSTPGPTAATTFPKFSLLSTELQLEILRLRLRYPKPITHIYHTILYRRLLLPLALVNKYFRNLAYEIYYQKNTFIISHSYTKTRFTYPAPSIRSCMRHVEVHIDIQRPRELGEVVYSEEIDVKETEYRLLLRKAGSTSEFTQW